jgi:2-hydroxychromene-2-carboxylate isomerase
MTAVEFWFEFASTYSYPAAMRIQSMADAAGVSLSYKPFLLGPVFARQGLNNSPFVAFPVKGQYMWRDLTRLCEDYGLPFQHPSAFPRNGLLAARVALLGAESPWGPAFVRAVYQANFVEDRDISRPEVIQAILRGLPQLTRDPETVLAEAGEPALKERLRAQTEEAERLGIFGAPSFRVNGELFWGHDRLEQALRWAKRT